MCFVAQEPDFSAVYREKFARDPRRAHKKPSTSHNSVVLVYHIPEALRQINIRSAFTSMTGTLSLTRMEAYHRQHKITMAGMPFTP